MSSKEGSMDWIIDLVFRTIQLAREKQLSLWETTIAIVCVVVGTILFFYLKHKKPSSKKNTRISKEKNDSRTTKNGVKNQESSGKNTALAKKNQTGQIIKRKKDENDTSNASKTVKKNKVATPKLKNLESKNSTITGKIQTVQIIKRIKSDENETSNATKSEKNTDVAPKKKVTRTKQTKSEE